MIRQHAVHVEIFDHDHLLGFRQRCSELVQRVLALIGNFPQDPAQATGRFLPILGAFLPAGHRPMEAFDLFQAAFEWRGLGMTVPSEKVASAFTPGSTPTTGPLFSGTLCSCSTCTLTYQ